MGYKVNPLTTEELRQMAVQRLGAPIAPDGAGLTGDQAKQLLEEVAISKIEIEIQNAYLQDTCARLDVALNEITDLYDFAPVGFVSTDAAGKISKLNLAGAYLLGSERNKLIGRVFVDFFSAEQRSRIKALMRRASYGGPPDAAKRGQCGAIGRRTAPPFPPEVSESLPHAPSGQPRRADDPAAANSPERLPRPHRRSGSGPSNMPGSSS